MDFKVHSYLNVLKCPQITVLKVFTTVSVYISHCSIVFLLVISILLPLKIEWNCEKYDESMLVEGN